MQLANAQPRNSRPLRISMVSTLALLLMSGVAQSSWAQTYNVIHTFGGYGDGAQPMATMTMDVGGNLLGTTFYGGAQPGDLGYGIVFKLVQKNSAWIVQNLYTFQGGSDGANPSAGVVVGANGSLYGTTSLGGIQACTGGFSCGLVFQLRPPITACRSVLCPWMQTVLYLFTGGGDGAHPGSGALTFDHAGNIYDTTVEGGSTNSGVAFQLTASAGGWQEKVLHSFGAPSDGIQPQAGVVFDSQGNLYGTTIGGGANSKGMVYELAPAGSGWTISDLHDIGIEGMSPYAGVVFDSAGNLYGATLLGGAGNGGAVYELVPSGGGWNFNLLYSFFPPAGQGLGPYSSLTVDAGGNLYGTTETDGAYGLGSVFELTPQNGGWMYTSLHDFAGGNEGCNPAGGVTLGQSGRLYGTASGCGAGYGVVWEITP